MSPIKAMDAWLPYWLLQVQWRTMEHAVERTWAGRGGVGACLEKVPGGSEVDGEAGSHQRGRTEAVLHYLLRYDNNALLSPQWVWAHKNLRYMQDPELHGLMLGQRKKAVSGLI